MENSKPYEQLRESYEDLLHELQEAKDTIEAIKNGEIDALVVQGTNGHELFTLKSADHTYRVFIEKMAEGAVTLDENGVIIYSNVGFSNMIGTSPTKVVSEKFEKFVISTDKDKFQFLIKLALENDIKGELVLQGNGKIVPVQLSISKIKIDHVST